MLYELFLFLIIFFGIFGAFKTVSLMYTFMVRRINTAIYRKEEDIKIWMKP
jgi:hypothetical protein